METRVHMNLKILVLVALLLPLAQTASARVYMCVDPQTGTTSFTDKACEKTAAREEVRVNSANYTSGRGTRSNAGDAKVWSSHRDDRKTGRDYNDDRRRLYQEKATASVTDG